MQTLPNMQGYPYDIWTIKFWTVKFPGDIWIAEIWTVKTGLGLLLQLGLVMTVHILTAIKTCNQGIAAPTFWPMANVVKWLDGSRFKMPFGIDYGGTCRPRPHCVRWKLSHKGHSSPLNSGRCLLWPNCWMDQNATWYRGRPHSRRHCVQCRINL